VNQTNPESKETNSIKHKIDNFKKEEDVSSILAPSSDLLKSASPELTNPADEHTKDSQANLMINSSDLSKEDNQSLTFQNVEAKKDSSKGESEKLSPERLMFEELLRSVRELRMPTNFNHLCRIASALDTALNFYKLRSKVQSFDEIKKSIESTTQLY
jgi:hypothetical protein